MSDLPAVTVRAVVADVVLESAAEWPGEITHVPLPGGTRCGPPVECVPLGQSLGLGDDIAGHLHRVAAPVGVDDTTSSAGRPSLQVLAELIELRITRDILDVRLAHARHESENLQVALESNRTIGIAIGIVMATRHCRAADAFALLSRASQETNRKVRDIAEDVLFAGVLPDRSSAAS